MAVVAGVGVALASVPGEVFAGVRVAFGIAVGTGVGMGVAVDATAALGVAMASGVASSALLAVAAGTRSLGTDPGRCSGGPRSQAASRASRMMARAEKSGNSRMGASTVVTTVFVTAPRGWDQCDTH